MKPFTSEHCSASAYDVQLHLHWAEEKINDWYKENPWPVGCNYISQYAINQLEMWQEESFDAAVINKERGWAATLGFNTVRVFYITTLGARQERVSTKNRRSFIYSYQI